MLFAVSVFAAPRLRGSHQQRLTSSVSPGDLIPSIPEHESGPPSVMPYEPPLEAAPVPSPKPSYPESPPIPITDSSHPNMPHQYLLPTPHPKLPSNTIPPMPPAYMLPYHQNHQLLLLPTPNPRPQVSPQVPFFHVSIPIYNLTGTSHPEPHRPTYQNNTDIISDCLLLSIPQSAALPPCGKYQFTGRDEL